MGYKKHRPTRAELVKEGINPDTFRTEGITPLQPNTDPRGGAMAITFEKPKSSHESKIEAALAETARRKRDAEDALLADARRRLAPAIEIAKKYVAAGTPLLEYGPKLEAARERLALAPVSVRRDLQGSLAWLNVERAINQAQGILNLVNQIQLALGKAAVLDARGLREGDFKRIVRDLESDLRLGNFDPLKTFHEIWAEGAALDHLAKMIVADAERQLLGM